MEARTTLGRSRISTAGVMTFAVACLAALLLGGAGGYVLRELSSAATPVNLPQSNVRQPAPAVPDWVYPKAQPTQSLQMLDPNGNIIDI